MSKSSNVEKENDMFRLCDIRNIPMATNIGTAEALIHALERGDLDWRDIMRED
jgi:methylglyoxal synthase